jgi:arylsulfatase A-like enzyme
LPSLLTITGAPKPAKVMFDGEDVSPILLGKSNASRSAPIFWRRPPDRKTAARNLPERLPDLAVREGEWKLVCEYDGSKAQLYNLNSDRSETTNVATQYRELADRLTKSVMIWNESMPQDNGAALGAETPPAPKAGPKKKKKAE